MAGLHVSLTAYSAVVLLAAVAHVQAAPQQIAAEVCSTFTHRDVCLKNSKCSWCGIADLAPSCVEKTLVSSLPSGAVKCNADDLGVTASLSGRKGAAGASHTVKLTMDSTCSADERDSCLALSGCSWCNSKVSWIASECFAEIGARNMDTSMFDCEASQTRPSVLVPREVATAGEDVVYGHKPTPGSYPPPPPIPCDDIVSKSQCNERKACNWCVLKFTGEGTCFTTTEAKYLPPFVFTCTKHHHHHLGLPMFT